MTEILYVELRTFMLNLKLSIYFYYYNYYNSVIIKYSVNCC